MYNNSEFCYYSSIVIKNRLPIDYSLDKEQTSCDDLLDGFYQVCSNEIKKL